MNAATGASRTQSLLDAGASTWQRFWHPEGSTLSLGLFRLIFALCLFLETFTTRAKSLFAIDGGFHLPYPFVPSFIRPVSEQTYELLVTLQYPLIGLLAAGLLMRPAIAGLLLLQGYIFFSDALNFRNHPYFFLLILTLLLFSPADESVSFKSIRRMVRDRRWSVEAATGPVRSLTFQRLIMVQVCLIYVMAGLQKLNPAFLDGSVLGAELKFTTPVLREQLASLLGTEAAARALDLLVSQPALAAAAVATVGIEFALPFTLWFQRTKAPSLIIGVGFHLLIAVLMNIPQFSYAMIGAYLLFLEPATLPALARRAAGRFTVFRDRP